MRHDTPLRRCHDRRAAEEAGRTPLAGTEARPGAATGRRAAVEVEYITYGPPDEAGLITCEVPSTFGAVEAEYAAIRRGAGLLDAPNRGTLRITGGDRRDFLERMLTQKLADLGAGGVLASFWLNRKGRIDADLLLVELGDEMLVDLDVHQAAATARDLGSFAFTEDIELVDATEVIHRISIHGAGALEVLAAAAGEAAALGPHSAARLTIGGVEVAAARRDQTGAPGVELFVPRDRAEPVWETLLGTGTSHGDVSRVRPIGWFAYNIARIEAGTPLFNVDFGTNNIPHESGVLEDRVSFTKGCYLGQEVVARVQSLGKPKQMLIGLRPEEGRLPVAGGQVFLPEDGGMSQPVGVVTSSTLAPMLGADPVAFAMIRSQHAEPGTRLLVTAEGAQVGATVCEFCFSAP